MTSIKTLALCLALSLPASAALAQAETAPPAANLALAFPDLKEKTGVVMVAMFDSPEAWASGKATQVAVAAAADPEPTARLADLKPGTYAARIYQDVNGDGKMGTNPFGLPTEPYGFTNGARANMGPPSFEAASFTVAPGDNLQTVTLK